MTKDLKARVLMEQWVRGEYQQIRREVWKEACGVYQSMDSDVMARNA